MKTPILLLCAIVPNLLSGQDSAKTVNKEAFYAINTHQSGRNFNYKKFDHFNDSVMINGYSKNAVKDSTWSVYNEKGELEQKFDFTHYELIYYKHDEQSGTQKYKVWLGNGFFDTVLDRPPLYIGGKELIFDSILKNLNYPEAASQNAISGDVLISFIIDKNGKARNHHLKKGIGYGCDEEALRVVKDIPDAWLAGILNGQAVDVEITLSINFGVQIISLDGQ